MGMRVGGQIWQHGKLVCCALCDNYLIKLCWRKILKENRHSLSQKLLFTSNQLFRQGQEFLYTFLSMLEICLLKFREACTGCHKCCEFICKTPMLFLENTLSLQSFTVSDFYNLLIISSSMISEPCEWVLIQMFHLEVIPLLYFLLPSALVGLFVNHHLLHDEASLVSIE